jgi:hypothetical protein
MCFPVRLYFIPERFVFPEGFVFFGKYVLILKIIILNGNKRINDLLSFLALTIRKLPIK